VIAAVVELMEAFDVLLCPEAPPLPLPVLFHHPIPHIPLTFPCWLLPPHPPHAVLELHPRHPLSSRHRPVRLIAEGQVTAVGAAVSEDRLHEVARRG
jgi:hypothetical protein